MIVYGDPGSQTAAVAMLRHLERQAAAISPHALDAWRNALITAGQLEQGVVDLPSGTGPRLLDIVQAIIDAAAAEFVEAYLGVESPAPNRGTHRANLVALCHKARNLAGNVELTIKVPEGFAFYSLYPEQYVMSAMRWSADHTSDLRRRVNVIGLRSIGTSLSALVTGTLRRAGWNVKRCTVRPGGHPFAREVEIPIHQLDPTAASIVVDEGPGLSGSSMSAVAEGLVRHGVRSADISFFPAHAKEPGTAASPSVLHWWRTVACYVTPLEAVRWGGNSLTQLLTQRLEARTGLKVVQVDDLSSGMWRNFAYGNQSEWPPTNISFERVKYLFTLSDGARVLWKFTGLQNREASFPATTSIARVPRMDTCLGFAAEPWIEGRRFTTESSSAMAAWLGRYISSAAAPPLADSDAISAAERLAEMLYWNTHEALGADMADSAHLLAARAQGTAGWQQMPSYGDGRMAPHEFVQSSDGHIWKTDWSGHEMDHTVIGKQNVLWDVAGAIVEWKLAEPDFGHLLKAVGVSLDPVVLDFHVAAYCAFRLGLLHMTGGDEADRTGAKLYYENLLRRCLHPVQQEHMDCPATAGSSR